MLGQPAAVLRWVIYLSLVMTTTTKTTSNVSYVSIRGLKDGPSGRHGGCTWWIYCGGQHQIQSELLNSEFNALQAREVERQKKRALRRDVYGPETMKRWTNARELGVRSTGANVSTSRQNSYDYGSFFLLHSPLVYNPHRELPTL